MKPQADIPVPKLMEKLARDPRGYPVPFIVLIDDGGAHFVINDSGKLLECVRRDLCSICGNPLLPLRMFIGGVRNAFHHRGAYIDPPVHIECGHYALQVCPFLAMPSYHGANIEAAKKRVTTDNIGFRDTTQSPGKPVMFVAVLAKSDKPVAVNGHIHHIPKHPYKRVEYWRDGKQLTWSEGHVIRDQVMLGRMSPTVVA